MLGSAVLHDTAVSRAARVFGFRCYGKQVGASKQPLLDRAACSQLSAIIGKSGAAHAALMMCLIIIISAYYQFSMKYYRKVLGSFIETQNIASSRYLTSSAALWINHDCCVSELDPEQ